MEREYKIIVRDLFLAYINKEAYNHSLTYDEYQYLSYHKLDTVCDTLCIVKKDWDCDILELVSSKRQKIRKQNEYYKNELDKLLLCFKEKEMNYAILKGWACLILLYSNITDRYFADIDILVEEDKLSEFEKILLEQGYRYGEEKNGVIIEPSRKRILFQRCFTHEIYNMVKKVEDCYVNIDINFRFSWKGNEASIINKTGFNDIYKLIIPYTYMNKEYNILKEEMFFIHLCCHFANEAWFFLLNTEYNSGDPKELRLFRLLDICLLLKKINMDFMWKLSKEMECLEHIYFVINIIKIVLGEEFAVKYFGNIEKCDRLNKFMTVKGEWKEWPISIEDRIFSLEDREKAVKMFKKL